MTGSVLIQELVEAVEAAESASLAAGSPALLIELDQSTPRDVLDQVRHVTETPSGKVAGSLTWSACLGLLQNRGWFRDGGDDEDGGGWTYCAPGAA